MPFDPDIIVPILVSVGHGLLAGAVLIQRGSRDRHAWLLSGYLAAAACWAGGSGLALLQPASLAGRWERLIVYLGLCLTVALLVLVQLFFDRWHGALKWLIVGGPWLAAAFLLDPTLVRLVQLTPLQVGGWRLNQSDLAHVLLALSWAFFTLALLTLSWRAYRDARSSLQRNRIRYLMLAVTLTVAGDGLFTLGAMPHTQIALLIRLGGSVAVTYALLSRHLPDIKHIYRQSINYITLTLITSLILFLGMWLPMAVFRTRLAISAVVGTVSVAVILALGYLPLRRVIQDLIDQYLFSRRYEYDRLLRGYGQRIADILDLDRLAGVVVGVIDEALDIERGALLVSEGGDDGMGKVRLKPYAGLGLVPDEVMEFRGSSPVLIHLRLKGLPLAPYDLTHEAALAEANQAELAWLRSLHMEVFVPMRAKERLIGVLAVGAKRSGEPYFRDDLDLLSALADQTAVALENARLFGDLVLLNTVLSQAYTDLGKANRQLQEMDRLKSAFIGVITHELRTPFANIDFSLQLLERYAHEHLSLEPRQQLVELAQGIEAAKTMVDNLVTFASFLSKRGELRLSWLNLNALIQETLLPLVSLAESKGVVFQVAVPENLPAVRGDPDRLRDAVYHLAQNAVKFTGSGGRVEARCWATAEAFYLEVKDTGVGIPPDKLPTLWEDFTQMADPLRRGREGLGLGLALVKYVVVAHGGDVWSKSQQGVGSTFGFQVPLEGPKPQAAGLALPV
ncbi:MAG: ATP-binding protein [Chloroflexota bacterium]